MSKRKGIRLQVLISVLILFVIISTVTIDWLISMHSYKKTMSENQLNNNYNYVQKLQTTAMHQLNYIQRNITAIANLSGSHTLTQADFDDWFETNDRHFSSIFMVDPDENILLMSPNQTNPESVIAPSEEKVLSFREPIKEVVHKKEPFISQPYFNENKELITLVSSPIFDKETEEYKGVVGSIHLEGDNVLWLITITMMSRMYLL